MLLRPFGLVVQRLTRTFTIHIVQCAHEKILGVCEINLQLLERRLI